VDCGAARRRGRPGRGWTVGGAEGCGATVKAEEGEVGGRGQQARRSNHGPVACLNNFLYVLYLYLLIISLVRVRCPVLPTPSASAAPVLPAPPASTASSAARVPLLILLHDFVPRPPPLPQLPLTPSLRLRFDHLLHLSRSRVSSFTTSAMWRQCQRCTAPLPGPLLCLRRCRLCCASASTAAHGQRGDRRCGGRR
jgi:hypothetical protein